MITSSIVIRASAAEVWQMVGDPLTASQWNPRVTGVSRASMSGPGDGARYRVTVRFGGRESTADLEIVEYEPLARMVTVLTGGRLQPGRSVTEIWTLEQRRSREITLRQSVDLSRSGIPLVWRIVTWLLHKIGRPVATPHLEILGQLVERNAFSFD